VPSIPPASRLYTRFAAAYRHGWWWLIDAGVIAKMISPQNLAIGAASHDAIAVTDAVYLLAQAIEQTEANLQRAKASVEKTQANYRQCHAYQRAPAKTGSDQLHLGRGGRNGKDGARRRTRGSESGE